jgi:flagellar hook-associated protein 1 FlgK
MSGSLMSLGMRAMAANYAALQTTGHNIANANVPGYSRQQAELATAGGRFTGAGFFGRGVDVATVSRAHNEFLTREAAATRSVAAMDGARLEQLRRLENVFKPGEAGLGHATTQLMQAMVDLASRPNDLSTRQVVLARAQDMAARFSLASDQIDESQASVEAGLKTAVDEVNGLTQGIAAVNQRIAALRGLGQPANDLLDEREQLISRLSAHVRVTRIEADDGTLGLFAGGGQRLVLGIEAVKLQWMQDPRDPARSAVGVMEFGNLRTFDENSLGGGSIAGMLRFQNDDLVAGRNLVGRLAAAVGDALNTQQMRGLNLQTPVGTVPSQALFSLGAARAINHDANTRDGAGNFVANITLTRTDSTALQASDYELKEDRNNPGSWQLTRLSDGKTSTVVSGDVVDGMQIDFGSPGPQPGDRFLLQPVGRAASDMKVLLTDPRDIAAASSLIATTGAANVGTASVQSLTVLAAPLPTPGATARVTFTSDSGDYTWELFDNNNVLLASGTDVWQAGRSIPAAPLDINGFSLQLAGVPRNGDTVIVAPTPAAAVASNNGNALSLVALRDAAIVGGRSATDAWALALSDIGVRVQSGSTSADISDAVAAQSELYRSAQAGVNLDEEAAKLIQFQQSYQAAAKVLQVAQSLFDTLLDAAG